MHDPEADADFAALRNIRSHLTVALLATQRLCRMAGALPPLHRLCEVAMDALLRVRDEAAGIENRLLRRERQSGSLSDAIEGYPPEP